MRQIEMITAELVMEIDKIFFKLKLCQKKLSKPRHHIITNIYHTPFTIDT